MPVLTNDQVLDAAIDCRAAVRLAGRRPRKHGTTESQREKGKIKQEFKLMYTAKGQRPASMKFKVHPQWVELRILNIIVQKDYNTGQDKVNGAA